MTKSKYQYNSATCRIVKFSKLKIQDSSMLVYSGRHCPPGRSAQPAGLPMTDALSASADCRNTWVPSNDDPHGLIYFRGNFRI